MPECHRTGGAPSKPVCEDETVESKVTASLVDRSRENLAASDELHHLVLGPGDELAATWQAAGLQLPDLATMRQYRLDRTSAQLAKLGYDGIIVTDPMNIRYVSDTTNM